MVTSGESLNQLSVSTELRTFLEAYVATLRSVFRERATAARARAARGLPPSILREILSHKPLAPFIPERFGGRGEHIHECLAVVDATAYESLAMSLTIGINGALFLQPVSKYGREVIKAPIFERFLEHQNMGGLMMTEPAFGSDALSMETSYAEVDGDAYRIRGVKHWAGLTGLADYWLVVARAEGDGSQLSRDVDFFVCDSHRPEQAAVVEEAFESLGLFEIPYGRNRIDVRVPKEHRLVPESTGLKMMLDLLHRSRLQFAAMGVGFLRRLLDEAVEHTRQRRVGGKSLIAYDQVQGRLARLQAAVTACDAMCLYTGENASVDRDMSKRGMQANAIKAVTTDLMQAGAQSLLQLVGAKGYRSDRLAGRALVDSRPFQIFEGSNDILYEQLAQAALKLMRRAGSRTFQDFLSSHEATSRAAEYVRKETSFTTVGDMPQRRIVDLGRVLGRIFVMEHVIELGERGFPHKLVDNCLEQFRLEVVSLLTVLRDEAEAKPVEHEDARGSWLDFVQPRTA